MNQIRRCIVVVYFVLSLAACSTTANAPESVKQTINPLGHFVEISTSDYPDGFTYRKGDLTIRIDRRDTGKGNDPDIEVIVERLGMEPVSVRSKRDENGVITNLDLVKFGIGQLEGPQSQPSVVTMLHSGGAHCCYQMNVVQTVEGKLEVVDADEWDGGSFEFLDKIEYEIKFPTDISEDGIADFVLLDNRFYYLWTSYAGSNPPPQIINVAGGVMRDVSTSTAFAKLFETHAKDTRESCLADTTDFQSAQQCLVYAASMARLGRFDQAYQEIAKFGVVNAQGEKLEDSVRQQLHEFGYINYVAFHATHI